MILQRKILTAKGACLVKIPQGYQDAVTSGVRKYVIIKPFKAGFIIEKYSEGKAGILAEMQHGSRIILPDVVINELHLKAGDTIFVKLDSDRLLYKINKYDDEPPRPVEHLIKLAFESIMDTEDGVRMVLDLMMKVERNCAADEMRNLWSKIEAHPVILNHEIKDELYVKFIRKINEICNDEK